VFPARGCDRIIDSFDKKNSNGEAYYKNREVSFFVRIFAKIVIIRRLTEDLLAEMIT